MGIAVPSCRDGLISCAFEFRRSFCAQRTCRKCEVLRT